MFIFIDLVNYLAKLCIQENLALICGIVEWCDFSEDKQMWFVCDRIGVSGMLDSASGCELIYEVFFFFLNAVLTNVKSG